MPEDDKKYNELLSHLAANIKAARMKKKYRQADMIDFGFSERFIQKLESGKYSPSLYTLHRVSCALEIPLDKLLKVHI